jgi:hypothetical protein
MSILLTAIGKGAQKLETLAARYWKHAAGATAVAYGASKYQQIYEDGATGLTSLAFPVETDSIGGFQTHLSFKSWKVEKHTFKDESGELSSKNMMLGQLAMDLYLPMPLSLGATYAGKFSEGDNMTYNRDESGKGSIQPRINSMAQSVMYQGMGMIDDLFNITNATKMAGSTVINNAPGALYEGNTLRSHNFSWRLTPRNADEQLVIDTMIRVLKLASTSAMTNIGGTKEEKPWLGGRLTIPHTVQVRFLDDGEENEHLFKTKECFITSIDVNYTTQGSWTAHEDGSPIETQITVSLKEITPVTFQEIDAFNY